MSAGDYRTRDDAKIFVSSRIPGLRKERQAIFDRLTSEKKGYAVFVYELVGSTGLPNEAFYLEAAAKARVLVLLYTSDISDPVIGEIKNALASGAQFLVYYPRGVKTEEVVDFLRSHSIDCKATQWRNREHLVELVSDGVSDTISLGLETLTSSPRKEPPVSDRLVPPPDADPSHQALYKSIGQLCSQGQYGDALGVITNFESSSTGAIHTHDTLLLKSYVARRQHKWEEALQLATAASQAVDTGRAALSVAVTLFLSGNEDAARIAAAQLEERTDLPTNAHSFLGRMAFLSNDVSKAVGHLRRLRPVRTRYWTEYYSLLSQTHVLLSEGRLAVKALESLLLRPSDEAPLFKMNLASEYLDSITEFNREFAKNRARQLLSEVDRELGHGHYMHKESEAYIRDQLTSTRAGLALADGDLQGAKKILTSVSKEASELPLLAANIAMLEEIESGVARDQSDRPIGHEEELPRITYFRAITFLEQMMDDTTAQGKVEELIHHLRKTPGGHCYGVLLEATLAQVRGDHERCLVLTDPGRFRRTNVPLRSDAALRRALSLLCLGRQDEALLLIEDAVLLLRESPTGFAAIILQVWARRGKWKGGFPAKRVLNCAMELFRRSHHDGLQGTAVVRHDFPWENLGEAVARLCRLSADEAILASLDESVIGSFNKNLADRILFGVGRGLT